MKVPRCRVYPMHLPLIRKWVQQGFTDRAIARQLGLTVSGVRSGRRRLRLASAIAQSPARKVAACRQGFAAVVAYHDGLTPGGHHRQQALQRGQQQGWPAGCTEGMGRILALLEDGPRTARQAAQRSGRHLTGLAKALAEARQAGWIRIVDWQRTYHVPPSAIYALTEGVMASRAQWRTAQESAQIRITGRCSDLV